MVNITKKPEAPIDYLTELEVREAISLYIARLRFSVDSPPYIMWVRHRDSTKPDSFSRLDELMKRAQESGQVDVIMEQLGEVVDRLYANSPLINLLKSLDDLSEKDIS